MKSIGISRRKWPRCQIKELQLRLHDITRRHSSAIAAFVAVSSMTAFAMSCSLKPKEKKPALIKRNEEETSGSQSEGLRPTFGRSEMMGKGRAVEKPEGARASICSVDVRVTRPRLPGRSCDEQEPQKGRRRMRR